MPLVPIMKVGVYGLVTDRSGDQLPPQTWDVAKNIECRDGYAQTARGFNQIFPDGTQRVEAIKQMKAPDGTRYAVYAGGTEVYVANESGHEQITTALTALDPREKYSLVSFHGIPVINSPQAVVQTWDFNVLNNTVNMAGLNTNFRFQRILSYKNFLIGLGFKNLADVSPAWNYKALVWSHGADPGFLPSSWDYTDPTLDAGLTELGETDDNLVDGVTLGSKMILYKEDTTWVMDYIGGPFIFRIDKMFGDLGLLAPNCAVEYSTSQGKYHLVVTKSDIRRHNGVSHESVLDRKLRKRFSDSLSREHADWTFVLHYQAKNEIWIFYPDEAAVDGCNKVLAWNYLDETFTERDTPSVRAGCTAVVEPNLVKTWDSFSGFWNEDSATWDSDLEAWDDAEYEAWELYSKAWSEFLANPNQYSLIAGTSLSADNLIFVYDFSNLANGSYYQCLLEKRDIALLGYDKQGAPIVDMGSTKICTEVWPHVRGNQPLQIFIGAADEVGGVLYWEGPFMFNPTVDRKIDCHVSGRMFGVKFQTFGQVDLKMDGYSLHITKLGVY